jgi:hypothetical protein
VITGVSGSQEKAHPGLAQRRAMEVAKRMQAYGNRGLQIVLKAPEEHENSEGVRIEVR